MRYRSNLCNHAVNPTGSCDLKVNLKRPWRIPSISPVGQSYFVKKEPMVRLFGPHSDLTDRKTDDPIVLEDPTPSANLLHLVELLKSSQKIVVVSGSGISLNAGCKILSLSYSLQTLTLFSSQSPMHEKADRPRGVQGSTMRSAVCSIT